MTPEQKKLAAYHKCYPMMKQEDDSFFYATWVTFSHIWDLAVESVKEDQKNDTND